MKLEAKAGFSKQGLCSALEQLTLLRTFLKGPSVI